MKLPVTKTRAPTAIVDLQAMRSNLQAVRRTAPHSKVIAIVKANAYGFGATEVAHALEDITDCFGVARTCEALKLRAAGVRAPILLLEGFVFEDELVTLAELELHTVVHDEDQLEALERAALPRPLRVWLKVDTGMHRLGVQPEDVPRFHARLSASGNVRGRVGFMTHLCKAAHQNDSTTLKQIRRFDEATAGLDGPQSIAASDGIRLWPASRRDFVRPGSLLYGPPCAGTDFQEVMTLKSCLIAVRAHKEGESVGYGGVWVAPRDTKLGVVAIGFGDGYPRNAPNGTPVWINGREVTITGKVSMDMLLVDLGPDARDKVGDTVVLWGEELPAYRVAEHVGMIYTIMLSRLSTRVIMEYVD